MKKLFLTMTLALATIFASAQFAVLTNVEMPEENASFEMSNLTDNLGVGYVVNDKIMVGAMKNGEDFDLFGRYLVYDMMWASVKMPTEDMTDNMTIGIGYTFNVWKEVYIEPNYYMPMNADDNGDREGMFTLGIAYYFKK